MNVEVKVPTVGESITSGILSTWHKKDGESVNSGDLLFTLETDKVSTEVNAPESGILRTQAAEGDEVKIDQVVAVIEPGAAPQAEKSAEPAQPEPAATAPPAPEARGRRQPLPLRPRPLLLHRKRKRLPRRNRRSRRRMIPARRAKSLLP